MAIADARPVDEEPDAAPTAKRHAAVGVARARTKRPVLQVEMLSRFDVVGEFQEHPLLERKGIESLLLNVICRLVLQVLIGFGCVAHPDHVRSGGTFDDIRNGIEAVPVPPRLEGRLASVEDPVVGDDGHHHNSTAGVVGLLRDMQPFESATIAEVALVENFPLHRVELRHFVKAEFAQIRTQLTLVADVVTSLFRVDIPAELLHDSSTQLEGFPAGKRSDCPIRHGLFLSSRL